MCGCVLLSVLYPEPTTTFPSGPVGCLVVDVGQGAVTRRLCYYLYAGGFRSVGMVHQRVGSC